MFSSYFSKTKIATATLLFAAISPFALAQQASPKQIAALMEEVAALRNEVGRLRADIEDLRIENARLSEKSNSRERQGGASQSEIAALRVEINGKFETLRREIFGELEKRISVSNSETNAALKKMQNQVNNALGSSGTTQKSTPQAPVARPSDLPENGVMYKIRGGDTLTKIAREHGSKMSWILYANEGLNPNRLIPGTEILIPKN